MTIKLPEIIEITHAGLEVASMKRYAYHAHGQYEITEQEMFDIKWYLQVEGHYKLDLADYLNLDCEKIHYEAF